MSKAKKKRIRAMHKKQAYRLAILLPKIAKWLEPYLIGQMIAKAETTDELKDAIEALERHMNNDDKTKTRSEISKNGSNLS